MSLYLWVKAFHIIFIIALMAGLLIYPRYKLHQLNSKPGDEVFETMKELFTKYIDSEQAELEVNLKAVGRAVDPDLVRSRHV